MPYTITEKILLAHTDKKEIAPGEFIEAKIDMALANDITAPIAIEEFERLGIKDVFDKEKIALIPDHFTPAKDIKSAGQAKAMREFASKYKLKHYYEVGRMGIEHALLPEMGLVLPGDLVIGADSHTCTYGALGAFATGVGSTDIAAAFATGACWLKTPETIRLIYFGKLREWVSGKDIILYTIGDIGVDGALYKALEFQGEAMDLLGMDDRFTMANMAIEAGAKSGIFAPNDTTFEYVRHATRYAPQRLSLLDDRKRLFYSDKDAQFWGTKEYDLRNLEPQVALPHLPSNVKPVSEVGRIQIDQVLIGSCTNGHITDLRTAADILKGKKVHPYVRLIVIPATQAIYLQAMKEGLIEIFIGAGAAVSTPTCGPCLGGHMGVLAKGEKALATTNRNFIGRMGHPESEVYLSNPAVAAASAVAGRIVHPREAR